MTTFCFDLDGTLCTNTEGAYELAQPYRWAIERVNALAGAGHRILIYTARGSSTGIDWRDLTAEQLERWGVSFHELSFGKPTADVFVDDRAYGFEPWRWGHTMVIPGPACKDEARRKAMAQGFAGLPPPSDARTVEVGRTFGGKALWLADHLDALLADSDVPHDRACLLVRLRAAVEPPGGVMGSVDEVVFTLQLATEVHPAYLDVYEPDAFPAIAVSCRPWREPARAVAGRVPNPRWSGVRRLALGDRILRGALGADVTIRRVAQAAQDAGFASLDGDAATGPGEVQLLTCAPFPLLAGSDPGANVLRLASALADVTGVDPLAELERVRDASGPGAPQL